MLYDIIMQATSKESSEMKRKEHEKFMNATKIISIITRAYIRQIFLTFVGQIELTLIIENYSNRLEVALKKGAFLFLMANTLRVKEKVLEQNIKQNI